MALVFKIRFQDTLRRLVVCEQPDITPTTLLTVQQLHDKIREMFSISPSDSLVITYVDTENDVVTLAEDQDLVDACLVQRLNPLRLLVQLRKEAPKSPSAQPSPTPPQPAQDGNLESFLKSGFPQATADAIKRFLTWYTDVVDPKLSAAALLRNAQEAFSEFLETLTQQGAHDGSRTAPHSCENAARGAFKQPCQPRDARESHCGGRAGKAGPSRVFHRGVQCDGCGMSPIEGPRFKSIKMVNYDLCSACFEAMGNETDYQKMELPAYAPPHGFYRPPFPMRGGRQFMGPPGPRCPFRMNGASFYSPNEVAKKLDARFVKDVTIFDGTELTPGTKFTKIWCLRNSGSVPWPQNTQLVHIGGDALSSEGVANIELPEGGLPCGDDIEASVDLAAPEKAGRYVSHWRLMSPSGQKFGHKIWVMIQVVPHGEQSPQLQESLIGEEIEDEEKVMVPGTEKEKEEVVVDTAEQHDTSVLENNDTEEININTGEQGNASDRSNVLVDDITVGKILLAVEKEQSEQNSNSVNRELDGFSVVEKPTEHAEWLTVSRMEASETKLVSSPPEQAVVQEQEQLTEKGPAEMLKTNQELQLQLLESMGFKERDLNTFLIEKNNQNFQHTLDDLVALAGWADLLKDLQEMGFDDNHTNCRLLIKNKGSIKRVVKDMVEMEKQKVGVKDKGV